MKEPIYIAKSKIKGEDVFASRNIKRGEIICEMRGEKISKKELCKVHHSGRDIVVDPLQVSKADYINMIRPYVLINHSCNPNAGVKREHLLIAIKKIRKGQEITYDYSSTWFDGFKCNCDSKSCRGHIGDFSGIPKSIQNKYKRLGIIPDFIMKDFRLKRA